MYQIRRGTFETNSSSTHSVSVASGSSLHKSNLKVDDEGYIHTHLSDYGWEDYWYDSQEDRLSYLVTMLAEIIGHHPWCLSSEELKREIQAIQESIEFQELSDEIASYAGAKGLILDVEEGYIDHQSVHYSSIREYFEYWNTSCLEFVFGNVSVHTDNDNQGYYDDEDY